MTQLRKLMLEEIQRRNFTESTTRAYLRIIEDFARHFHRPPDQLGPDHIREYTAHLFRDKKLSDNSVNQTVGALRFFFVKMLKRPWGVEETPYPKKRMRLPVILSRDEVARLIESAPSPFHRTILMTLYATGVRRTELAHLKVTDVDSERLLDNRWRFKGAGRLKTPYAPRGRRSCRVASVSGPQTGHVVISRRPLAYRRLPDHRQGRLERLSPSRPRSRHSQSAPSAYTSALFRHPPARVRRRPAHHPGSPRPQRSQADRYLYPRVATASQRYRQPAGCPADVCRPQRPIRRAVDAAATYRGGRCHPRSWRELL